MVGIVFIIIGITDFHVTDGATHVDVVTRNIINEDDNVKTGQMSKNDEDSVILNEDVQHGSIVSER